jgi:hypothetical protein
MQGLYDHVWFQFVNISGVDLDFRSHGKSKLNISLPIALPNDPESK